MVLTDNYFSNGKVDFVIKLAIDVSNLSQFSRDQLRIDPTIWTGWLHPLIH